MVGRRKAGVEPVNTNVNGSSPSDPCGDIDPLQMAEIVSMLREATDLPIVAQPNAGRPKLAGGRTTFDMAPDLFAKGVAVCVDAGARWVGGCCGTSPEHMQALAHALAQ